MNFVKSNTVELQNQISIVEPTHYIFALDNSGSMEGKEWEDLM